MNHPKISELLPWYVNGTLDLGDRQAAALEVASCDECAGDVEEMTRVQAAMLELEAQAPEPSEFAFAQTLAAVEEEEEKKRLGHPWFGWWWALTPFRRALVVSCALGAAVAAGIVAAPKPPIGVSPGESVVAQTPITLESMDKTLPTVRVSAQAALTAANSSGVAVSRQAPAAAPATQPQVARTGSVDLLVSSVEAAIGTISDFARAQGGEVVSLSDNTPSQQGLRHTASIQVSIPDDRFDATVVALAKMGGLQSRSVSAEDVGGQIVDAQARLRNLRTTEADLLKIMNRAGNIDEVLQVENQVSTTREQIEELAGQVTSLKHRVAFSSVTVNVEDQAPSPAVALGAGVQLRDTWIAALRSVQTFTLALIGGILWGVAYLPYALLIALIGWLAAMRLGRSNEEQRQPAEPRSSF